MSRYKGVSMPQIKEKTMIDVGVSEKIAYDGMEVSRPKNAKIYPSLSIEKDIGDFKIGQSVTILCEAEVESLHKDKRSIRTSFKIKAVKVGKQMTKQLLGKKLAGEYLNKK